MKKVLSILSVAASSNISCNSVIECNNVSPKVIVNLEEIINLEITTIDTIKTAKEKINNRIKKRFSSNKVSEENDYMISFDLNTSDDSTYLNADTKINIMASDKSIYVYGLVVLRVVKYDLSKTDLKTFDKIMAWTETNKISNDKSNLQKIGLNKNNFNGHPIEEGVNYKLEFPTDSILIQDQKSYLVGGKVIKICAIESSDNPFTGVLELNIEKYDLPDFSKLDFRPGINRSEMNTKINNYINADSELFTQGVDYKIIYGVPWSKQELSWNNFLVPGDSISIKALPNSFKLTGEQVIDITNVSNSNSNSNTALNLSKLIIDPSSQEFLRAGAKQEVIEKYIQDLIKEKAPEAKLDVDYTIVHYGLIEPFNSNNSIRNRQTFWIKAFPSSQYVKGSKQIKITRTILPKVILKLSTLNEDKIINVVESEIKKLVQEANLGYDFMFKYDSKKVVNNYFKGDIQIFSCYGSEWLQGNSTIIVEGYPQ